MAQSNIDIKIIAEFLGKSAFKQADTAANKLNKTVKSLGQSFGVAFGGAALGYAIKSTIRDFADAERETQQLTNTVKNLGLAFAAPEIDAYVQNIGKLYGVTGDQAVPAMQALLTATGSVSRSTKIMNVALDLAASRNADVAQVAKDLASAYVGNTKGLNQYKLGLTKAELAALSFDEILEKIGSQTLGSADEAAKTLSGQLAILSEVTNQAKERIGGGLVQALGGLGGANGAGGAAKNIENLSIKLTNAITGFGYLVQEIKVAQPILVAAGIAIGLAWAPWFTAIAAAGLAIGAIGNAMKKNTPKTPLNTGNLFNQGKLFFPTGGDAGYNKRKAEEKKAEEAAAARAKKLEAMAKASEKAQKESLKLAKAKAIFDLQKIQIEAALKGKLSEEDKIRLKLLQAIEEENLTNVEKYEKALEKAQDKAKELQAALDKVKAVEVKDPFSTWKVDPLTTAITGLTGALGEVRTGMTSTGVAWSEVAAKIAATEVKPNLSEFKSSFKMATDESESAVETAVTTLGSLTSTATASIGTATTSATDTTNTAIASSGTATANTIVETSQAAADALDKLYNDSNAALSNATTATVTDFMATSSAALDSLKEILAAEAAAYTAAAAAASQQAAADAADLAGAGTAGGGVNITVNTGVGDPNAIAEAIQQVLIDAGNRGTLDLQGIG
jgi:hypothetical protein